MRHRNTNSHTEIIESNIDSLKNSNDELSRHLARALPLLPLPPAVGSTKTHLYEKSDMIRSEWSFQHDSGLPNGQMMKVARFTLWLGQELEEMMVTLHVNTEQGCEDNSAFIRKGTYDENAVVTDNTYGSDEVLAMQVESLIDDMECGILRYDESGLAQVKRARAFEYQLENGSPAYIQRVLDEAHANDIEHRMLYGIDL